MSKTISSRISQLSYTAEEWASKTATILLGEICFESDTGRIKIGDGTKAYSALPYATNTVALTEAQIGSMILSKGIMGYATDSNKLKVGDGTKTWNQLPLIMDMDYIQQSLTYTNSTPMTISVGGYAAGTTFEGQTVEDMLNGLLYPYVATSIRSVSTGPQNGGTYEYGLSKSISSCTVNLTKGSTNVTKIEILNSSNQVIATKTDGVTGTGQYSVTVNLDTPLAVSSGGNVQLKAKVYDNGGSKSYTSGNTGAYGWIYPFYKGIAATDKTAATLTATEVQIGKDLSGRGQKTYSFTTNDNKAMIAYPKAYGVLKKITDGSGVTDYTKAFGTPATISLSSTSPAWGPVEYYVYTNGNSTASNFTYKFNF